MLRRIITIDEEKCSGCGACAAACHEGAIEMVNGKAKLVRDMRAKYLAGDRAWLRETAHVDIPRMLQKYDKLMALHQQMWDKDMKRNGWEVVCLRYGGVMARLADVTDELVRYLAGELKEIVELEETPLSPARIAQHYAHMVTPSAALGTGF